MRMKRRDIWMVIACAVPLLLIFVLPLLGFSDAAAVVSFIFFLFAGHMLLIGFHGSGHAHGAPTTSKETHHGSH